MKKTPTPSKTVASSAVNKSTQYWALMRLLVLRARQQSPGHDLEFRTVDEVPRLTNDETRIIIRHLPGTAAEGMADTEPDVAEVMGLVDYTQDPVAAKVALAEMIFDAVRKKAAQFILKDLREVALEAIEGDQFDAGYDEDASRQSRYGR